MIQKLTENDSFARFLCVFTNRFPDLTNAAARSNDPVRYFLDNTSIFLSEKRQGVVILMKCACKCTFYDVYIYFYKGLMIYSFPHLQQIISTYCPTFNARCSKDSVYSPPCPIEILHNALCPKKIASYYN